MKTPEMPDQIFAQDYSPVVILARPQMGENIGAAARAMKNCGLSSLRLIAPRDGWPNPAARPMATVGTDILDRAEVYETLAEALHDIRFMVATSARPRDMEKPVMARAAIRLLLEEQISGIQTGGRVALLLGQNVLVWIMTSWYWLIWLPRRPCKKGPALSIWHRRFF